MTGPFGSPIARYSSGVLEAKGARPLPLEAEELLALLAGSLALDAAGRRRPPRADAAALRRNSSRSRGSSIWRDRASPRFASSALVPTSSRFTRGSSTRGRRRSRLRIGVRAGVSSSRSSRESRWSRAPLRIRDPDGGGPGQDQPGAASRRPPPRRIPRDPLATRLHRPRGPGDRREGTRIPRARLRRNSGSGRRVEPRRPRGSGPRGTDGARAGRADPPRKADPGRGGTRRWKLRRRADSLSSLAALGVRDYRRRSSLRSRPSSAATSRFF